MVATAASVVSNVIGMAGTAWLEPIELAYCDDGVMVRLPN